MRPVRVVPLLLALAVLSVIALATTAEGADNHSPTTAAPLDDHNHITEEVNGSDDEAEYWYWMDIERGDELFVYFYGTGEVYHRCRMLYYVHGPDSHESSDVVHSEYWYRQKADRNDYSDVWSWICPEGGRYYLHFFAVGEAVGPFHANVSRDSPGTMFRYGTDTGTLWWRGVADLNKNDVWRIMLSAGSREVEGVEVTLSWTNDHRLHLYAYDLVDRFEQNMLNLSYAHSGDRREVIRFTASYTGWYYVRVEYGSWSGSEDYTLATQTYSAPNDGDNDLANATHVLKSGSHRDRIEASRDMHDWYTMDLVRGDLLGISMQIMDPHNPDYNPGSPNFYNFFEIQVYDPYMRRVDHGYDRNGGWPVPDTYINNLPIQPADIKVNGTYYMRASFSHSYGYYYDAQNTSGHVIAFCDYVLQVTIPNRAPRVNATALEDVYMLEDTTWWENLAGKNVSSLDLRTVFLDPEQGVMTFSARGNDNLTARLVDEHLVTLKPARDWNGEARVTLRAEDDSGNSASAKLRVLVIPVNDPPAPTFLPPPPIQFLEDDPSVENRTINMYDLYFDVDINDAHNLTFSLYGEPRDMSVTFDQTTGNVTFEPAEDLSGDFFHTFIATDTGGLSDYQEFKIRIIPVNDPPKPLGDPPTYTFEEGFMLETFDATDHILDPDGDTDLIWQITYVDPGDEGNLSVTNEGKSIWNSEIVLTPAEKRHDWYGTVQVVVTCTDPGGLSGSQMFIIVILNTPDPPEIAAWTPRTDATFAEGENMTFSVDDVQDPDGEDAVLHFSFWLYRTGDLTAHEVQNGTSPSWDMVADHEAEGTYKVTVIVYDEDLMSTVSPLDWQVTVTKTNRAPTVIMSAPSEGQSFKTGDWVDMSATVDDPDAEDLGGLVVDWYDGETWLGEGRTFSVRNLKPGTHVITAVVTDGGEMSSETTVTIKVVKKDEGPGFGVFAAVLATVLATMLATLAMTPLRTPRDRR